MKVNFNHVSLRTGLGFLLLACWHAQSIIFASRQKRELEIFNLNTALEFFCKFHWNSKSLKGRVKGRFNLLHFKMPISTKAKIFKPVISPSQKLLNSSHPSHDNNGYSNRLIAMKVSKWRCVWLGVLHLVSRRVSYHLNLALSISCIYAFNTNNAKWIKWDSKNDKTWITFIDYIDLIELQFNILVQSFKNCL